MNLIALGDPPHGGFRRVVSLGVGASQQTCWFDVLIIVITAES